MGACTTQDDRPYKIDLLQIIHLAALVMILASIARFAAYLSKVTNRLRKKKEEDKSREETREPERGKSDAELRLHRKKAEEEESQVPPSEESRSSKANMIDLEEGGTVEKTQANMLAIQVQKANDSHTKLPNLDTDDLRAKLSEAEAERDDYRKQAQENKGILENLKQKLYDEQARRQQLEEHWSEKERIWQEQAARWKRGSDEHNTTLGEISRLREANKMANEQWQAAMRELKTKNTMLEARTEEVEGLRAYMAIHDGVSGADLIRATTQVNTEIHQTASRLADTFEFGQQQKAHPEAVSQAEAWVGRHLGAEVVRLLQAKDDEDPTVVQIALQAMMVSVCYNILVAWTSNRDQNTDQALSLLEHGIKTYELPSAAKRWRILTRRHLRILDPNKWEASISSMSTFALDILVASRCQAAPENALAMIKERFEGSFRRIVSMTISLKKNMVEEFASMDMATIITPSGATFEDGRMADAYKPRRGQSVGRVACTVGLGLANLEAHKRDDRTWEYRMTRMLKKPSVVLSTAFADG